MSDSNCEETPKPNEAVDDNENGDEVLIKPEVQGQSEKSRQPKGRPGAIKFVLIALVALFGLGVIVAMLPCDHNWKKATCTKPEICETCGEEHGEPLGHVWVEATCESAKACSRCGKTEAKSLDHSVDNWQLVKGATCSTLGEETGQCSLCGENLSREVPMIDHVPGEWVQTKNPTVTSGGIVLPGEKQLSCSACGMVLQAEPVTMEVSLSQKNALGKAADYLSFSAFSYKGLVDQLEFEGFSTADVTFAADYCGADWNVQAEKKAADYLDFMSFSHAGLVDQLVFEGFTYEQAEHGVSSTGL